MAELTLEEKKIEFLKSLDEKKELLSSTYKCRVSYQVFLGKEFGGEHEKTLVAWFKQPHIMVAATAMDLVIAGKYHECGFKIWDACFIAEHSDVEVLEDKYKIGLLGHVGLQVEFKNPDVKKS